MKMANSNFLSGHRDIASKILDAFGNCETMLEFADEMKDIKKDNQLTKNDLYRCIFVALTEGTKASFEAGKRNEKEKLNGE